MNVKIISIVSLFIFSFIGCSSSELMMSNSVEQKITIDGNHEDWSGKLKYLEDEKVAIGFQNDSENLYFCLVSSDRANAMKIMMLGLTVWFESENEQEIGLQYPIRIEGVSPRRLMGLNSSNQQYPNFEGTVNSMMQNQSEFNLVDEDEEIIYTAPLGSNDGFEIKIGSVNQQFVYEAKVPIGNNKLAQIPINIFPNERVAIQFETGEIDIDEMRESGGMQQPGMGSSQGGRGGGMKGGGQSGMKGGSRSGSSNRMGMERLSLDVEVQLTK